MLGVDPLPEQPLQWGMRLQSHQRASVLLGERARTDVVTDRVGQPGHVEQVVDVLPGDPDHLADLLPGAQPETGAQPGERVRTIDRVELLALDVLDERLDVRAVVVGVDDDRGDVLQAGAARRTPATLAGDDLIAVLAAAAHPDRLEHTVHADAAGQLLETARVDATARLVGPRPDALHRDSLHLRPRRARDRMA